MTNPADNPSRSAHNEPDELLSAYLDGELTEAERALVDERLATDPAAQQTIDELRAVSGTLRGMPPATPNAEFADSVMQRVGALDVERPTATLRGDAADNAAAPRWGFPFGRSPRSWLWAGLAVAAALLLMVANPSNDETGKEVATIKSPASAGGLPAEMSAPLGDLGLASEAPSGGETPLDLRMEMESAADPAAEAADFTPMATVQPVEEVRTSVESPLLFVRVQLRSEAFGNRFVDELLQTQGIAVDQDRGDAARPRDARDSASRSREPLSYQQRFADTSTPEQASATADVLMVDASAKQVALCLDELKNDLLNCRSLYVEPNEEPPPTAALQQRSRASKSMPIRKQAVNTARFALSAAANSYSDNAVAWQFYNRAAPWGNSLAQLRCPTVPEDDGDADRAEQSRAYRLAEPLRQQVARQVQTNNFFLSEAEASRLREQRGVPLLPAPTDDTSRVNTLWIVEPEPAAAAEPSPATPAGS